MVRLLQFLMLFMASMPLLSASNIEDFLAKKEAQVSAIAENDYVPKYEKYDSSKDFSKYEYIISKEGKSYPIAVITLENYPQAYAWYQEMMKKYPEADLDQYSFVVGGQDWGMFSAQYVESKRALIGCPYNKLYGGFIPDDEAALLHEAGHAHNHENWSPLFKGGTDITTLSKLGIIAAVAAGSSHMYNQNHFGLQQKLQYDPFAQQDLYSHLKGSATFAGLLAAPIVAYYCIKKGQVIAWRKLDERYADKFANRYADADALKGCIEHFDRHACYQPKLKDMLKCLVKPNIYFEYYPGFIRKIEAILDTYKYYLSQISSYLCEEHPYCDSRANEARKALKKRFGQEVALA